MPSRPPARTGAAVACSAGPTGISCAVAVPLLTEWVAPGSSADRLAALAALLVTDAVAP